MKKFGYENLDVWNRAVDFAVKVIEKEGKEIASIFELSCPLLLKRPFP